jgi:hypothetical protein
MSGLTVMLGVVAAGLVACGILAVLASIGMSSDVDRGGHVFKSGIALLVLGGVGWAAALALFFWQK